MRNRSLSGLSILLAGASCVPPSIVGASHVATASVAVAPRTFDMTADLRLPAMPGPVAMPAAAPMAPNPASALVAAPVAAPPFSLAAQSVSDADRAVDCLTAAVYYEARSESIDGQRAVAQVVLNRVRSPAFPSSVCGVVYQRSAAGCQFTFVCDGSRLYRREPAAWDTARQVAQAALDGSVYAPVGSATYYHTNAVQPWWSRAFARVAEIGAHIFYGWRAAQPQSATAFHQSYAGIEPGETPVAAIADGFATPTPPGTRYRVVDGSVTVHRGSAPTALAAITTHRTPLVRVHVGSGGPAVTAPDEAVVPAADAPADTPGA